MKIIKDYPPNIEDIRAVLNPPFNTVFTYGNNIYNPNINQELPSDLIAHERVHILQQEGKPAAWWDKYLKDKNFRFAEELMAYKVQWKVIKSKYPYEIAFHLLHGIVSDLSGEMYGNIVDYTLARDMIKQ